LTPPLLGVPFSPTGWIPISVRDPKRGGQIALQATGSFGGNPDVRPDHTRSLNMGVVLEPRFVPGLRASIDYARIERRDGISSLQWQAVVDNEDLLPGRVERGPVSSGDPFGVGPITHVDGTTMNVSRDRSVNYNFTVDYQFGTTGKGAWQVFAIGNSWQHYQRQLSPDQPPHEMINTDALVSQQQSKFSGSAGINWTRGSWSTGWSSRFFGAYRVPEIYRTAQGSDHVTSQLFHDIYVGYTFRSGKDTAGSARVLPGLTVQIGAKNVFNTKPAFDAGNPSTYHSAYGDLRLGRYYVTVRKRF
jgi:iron complex outermembrane recepter protein